jgi:hypothetical protein
MTKGTNQTNNLSARNKLMKETRVKNNRHKKKATFGGEEGVK